ncbi:uncharacterized protein LOC116203314 isoform X2 [Punica granatum]|uniref:Uncharacterized protein LOC116203314 isoform X2 n=1 Tax=Punica granatum TaxID=22663 RepID=A0A6P8D196_PUNGR|nr:uncharacterized protein LOC116203314 isoform X2 [Punica granatum]
MAQQPLQPTGPSTPSLQDFAYGEFTYLPESEVDWNSMPSFAEGNYDLPLDSPIVASSPHPSVNGKSTISVLPRHQTQQPPATFNSSQLPGDELPNPQNGFISPMQGNGLNPQAGCEGQLPYWAGKAVYGRHDGSTHSLWNTNFTPGGYFPQQPYFTNTGRAVSLPVGGGGFSRAMNGTISNGRMAIQVSNPDFSSAMMDDPRQKTFNYIRNGWQPSATNQQSLQQINRTNVENMTNNSTSRSCNCKKTKCNSRHCGCFAVGIYCQTTCKCQNCLNDHKSKDKIMEARQSVLSRDSAAFEPRVINNTEILAQEQGNYVSTTSTARHRVGCNCKHSLCKKGYCECYQARVRCCDACRCEGCRNTFGVKSGSRELANSLEQIARHPSFAEAQNIQGNYMAEPLSAPTLLHPLATNTPQLPYRRGQDNHFTTVSFGGPTQEINLQLPGFNGLSESYPISNSQDLSAFPLPNFFQGITQSVAAVTHAERQLGTAGIAPGEASVQDDPGKSGHT